MIYVSGGVDLNGTVTNDVIRAETLDPKEALKLSISVDLSSTPTNFTSGGYQYRVSVVYLADDARNPGGESLPSNSISIVLPAAYADILTVTISWPLDPRAAAYRVYRSSSADSDNIVLIDEVTDLFYRDEGDVAVSTMEPLLPGALGVWNKVVNTDFLTEREGHELVTVASTNDPNIIFLYAFSGRDSNGVYLDDYERITVDISTREHSITGPWTARALDVAMDPMAEFAAYSFADEDYTMSLTNSWIFVMGGMLSETTASPQMHVRPSSSFALPHVSTHTFLTLTGDGS